jgi:hypothetical protein|tara:strand:+ start:371 stop:742 length:372 start_codon:yes stop_codon:yes gene_type:complete
MKVDISKGELIDKITILEIKMDRIKDENKLKNIKNELDILYKLEFDTQHKGPMKDVNVKIWDCEELIRKMSMENPLYQTDIPIRNQFIQCAINIHIFNDERARIKKLINVETGSEIVEEKSFF